MAICRFLSRLDVGVVRQAKQTWNYGICLSKGFVLYVCFGRVMLHGTFLVLLCCVFPEPKPVNKLRVMKNVMKQTMRVR